MPRSKCNDGLAMAHREGVRHDDEATGRFASHRFDGACDSAVILNGGFAERHAERLRGGLQHVPVLPGMGLWVE